MYLYSIVVGLNQRNDRHDTRFTLHSLTFKEYTIAKTVHTAQCTISVFISHCVLCFQWKITHSSFFVLTWIEPLSPFINWILGKPRKASQQIDSIRLDWIWFIQNGSKDSQLYGNVFWNFRTGKGIHSLIYLLHAIKWFKWKTAVWNMVNGCFRIATTANWHLLNFQASFLLLFSLFINL